MASPTRYVIEIKLTGGSGAGGAKASSARSKKKTRSASGASGSNASGEENKKLQRVEAAAAGYALAVASSVTSHYVNSIELRTGQALYQQRIQNAIGIGKQIGSFGAVVAGGAVIGGVAGGVVSAVGYAAVAGVNYYLAESTLAMERSVESVGLAQASVRAGAGGSRDGKGY